MSYASELTKQRILKHAQQDFLNYGFMDSNIRRIAKNAKVTTGALYNHFKNKEVIFSALVESKSKELLEEFNLAHKKCRESVNKEENSYDYTDWMLNFLYDNYKVFKLITSCATGTKYSGYIDELIKIEEVTAKLFYTNGDDNEVNKVDNFFIHVISSMGINNMFEAIEHDLNREEAFAYIDKIKKFYFAGWKGLTN